MECEEVDEGVGGLVLLKILGIVCLGLDRKGNKGNIVAWYGVTECVKRR